LSTINRSLKQFRGTPLTKRVLVSRKRHKSIITFSYIWKNGKIGWIFCGQ